MQEDTSFCPSFSSYTSDKLADIAVKVCQETNDDGFEAVEEEFEFVSLDTTPDPIFPVFNRDLLLDNNNSQNHTHDDDVASIRFPLKKLFIEDHDDDPPSSSSSSSSESGELERIEPGTYCVWNPKSSSAESSSPSCKKSNSTGSSSFCKRWRFRDLLKRSHSEGKNSHIYLNSNSRKEEEKIEKNKEPSKVKVKAAKMSAHEEFYVRNKVLKEGDKRRSYLPYRQDLVGFFSNNMNGLGKTFPF